MVSVEYLAGFVDGEGSLTLSRIPRGANSTEYCIRVSIANTDTDVLTKIQSEYGGTLHNMGGRRPNWKPGYNLIWTNVAAAEFLKKVEPFLRVKVEQAAVLLEFDEHLRNCHRRRDSLGRLLPLSEREGEIRKAFYWRVRLLNVRGSRGALLQRHRRSVQRFLAQHKGEISQEYLAGFIDAEGSLVIARTRIRGCKGAYYRGRVTVANTRREILVAIQSRYGGTLAEDPRASSAWKRSYQLIWTNRVAERLLLEVGPHLQVKRERATVLLQFLRHVRSTPRARGRDGRRFAPHPEDVIRVREALYQRIRQLNARGM